MRVADHLEHRCVGDGVAVGVAPREVVAAVLGQLEDRPGLLLGVRVVVDVPGVLAVRLFQSTGHHDVGAEHRADRLDHLGAARRDDDDVATGQLVLLDQADRFVVDQRVDDVVEGVRHDLPHRRDVPTGHQL